MPVGGRVAGKVGIYSSHYNGNVDMDIILLGIYEATSGGAVAIFAVYNDEILALAREFDLRVDDEICRSAIIANSSNGVSLALNVVILS